MKDMNLSTAGIVWETRWYAYKFNTYYHL